MKLIKELLETHNSARFREVDILVVSLAPMNLADLYDADDEILSAHSKIFDQNIAKKIVEYLKTKGEVSHAVWKPSEIMNGIDSPLAQFFVWTSEQVDKMKKDIADLMKEQDISVSVWASGIEGWASGQKNRSRRPGLNLLESKNKRQMDILVMGESTMNLADLYDGDDDSLESRVNSKLTFSFERAKEVLELLKQYGEVSWAIWKPSEVNSSVYESLAQYRFWTNMDPHDIKRKISNLMLKYGIEVSVWSGETGPDDYYTKHEGRNLLEAEQQTWKLQVNVFRDDDTDPLDMSDLIDDDVDDENLRNKSTQLMAKLHTNLDDEDLNNLVDALDALKGSGLEVIDHDYGEDFVTVNVVVPANSLPPQVQDTEFGPDRFRKGNKQIMNWLAWLNYIAYQTVIVNNHGGSTLFTVGASGNDGTEEWVL
jgi:hypothetical protein